MLFQVLEQHGLGDGTLLQAALEHAAVLEEYERRQSIHLQS